MYRYRITVEVDTPVGPRTGSAVRELVYRGTPVHEFTFRRELQLSPDSQASSIDFKGEAVTVDMGEGATLYALVRLSGPDFVRSMMRAAFGQTDGSVLGFKALLDDAQSRKREGAVAPLDYPTFVVFRDERDPESVLLVEPRHAAEHLGAGVTINSVMISMTDDPVTSGTAPDGPGSAATRNHRSRPATAPWAPRYPPRCITATSPEALQRNRDFLLVIS